MTTKRVESLRAPCLDARSTLATSTFEKSDFTRSFFFVSVARSFNRWRLGRLVCVVAVVCCRKFLSL